MPTWMCTSYIDVLLQGWPVFFARYRLPLGKPDTQPSGRGVGRHPTMNTGVEMDHRAGFAPSLSGFADPHLIYSAIGG